MMKKIKRGICFRIKNFYGTGEMVAIMGKTGCEPTGALDEETTVELMRLSWDGRIQDETIN